MAHDAWSETEVEAIVTDYLRMLTLDLSGQHYSKTAHRRNLQSSLNDRSDGSIELKHQNISAVLIELGCPPIPGYKPRGNYQKLLFEVVHRRILTDHAFNASAEAAANQPAATPLITDLAEMLTGAPLTNSNEAKDEGLVYGKKRLPIQRDYLALEALNRSLGKAGEELIVSYEQDRLFKSGKKKLADRVEHVAVTQGDGLGYDVLSFDESGKERFIEVKTTAFTKETPFYVSKNEVDFSEEAAANFHLYRLFSFRKKPGLFTLDGAIRKRVTLDAVSYLARL